MEKHKLETFQFLQARRYFLKNAGAIGLGLIASTIVTDLFAQDRAKNHQTGKSDIY